MTNGATKQFRVLLAGTLLTFSTCTAAFSAEKQVFEAEAAQSLRGASRLTDNTASGVYLVRLSSPGDGVKFVGVPPAGKLAIRYASVEVGTISVAVNDQ